MGSQAQNPEFWNNPEKLSPMHKGFKKQISHHGLVQVCTELSTLAETNKFLKRLTH